MLPNDRGEGLIVLVRLDLVLQDQLGVQNLVLDGLNLGSSLHLQVCEYGHLLHDKYTALRILPILRSVASGRIIQPPPLKCIDRIHLRLLSALKGALERALARLIGQLLFN